jgi:hypothetical protein
MPRTRKAVPPTPVPTCSADGKPKHIYPTQHAAEVAAEIASSRTYGVAFTTYRCGNHWHIAHAAPAPS